MPITGNEDHSITLTTASKWTKNYRLTIATGDTIAHGFGKTAILAILNQTGCYGLRMYYAYDDLGLDHLILVGTDSSGNDLYNGLLAERSIHCPEDCSSANPLNTSSTT